MDLRKRRWFHGGRRLQFHDQAYDGGQCSLELLLAKPYCEDPPKAVESIPDTRIRSLFVEHQAWLASATRWASTGCSLNDEIREWYRRLGRLFVELFDENCLSIYVSDLSLAFPINKEHLMIALRSWSGHRASVGLVAEEIAVVV